MRFLVFFLFLSTTSFCIKAQNSTGLWQGQWSSPDGYVFDFVLNLNEYPDGSVDGFINWKFIKAPEGDWYYDGKEGWEAVEYVKGRVNENRKVVFEGYKKDDPNSIIALDMYRLSFDETFHSFSGTTGNHGSWAAKIEAIRIGLP